jgi:hypothetical protein
MRMQGRGLLYWVSKMKDLQLKQDLLVRGIELGPISYRRRPSTSCQPDFAESLGYVATIAGLEYFAPEVPRLVEQVRVLVFMRPSVRALGTATSTLQLQFLKPDAYPPRPVQSYILGSDGGWFDTNEGVYEAVFRACCSGDAEWLREVLQEREAVSGLLTRAIVSGQPGAVEMLLRAGLDLGKEPDLENWSALTYAAVNMDCRVLGVLLSDEGTRSLLDHRDADGCTALWWANCLGRREAAGMLMRAGAKIELQNHYDTCVWKTVSPGGREEYHHRIGVSCDPTPV